MAPGDLVELFDDNHLNDYIVVGELNNTEDLRRRVPFGTLVLLMGEYPGQGEPASVVLAEGKPGWVWDYEIRPANHATPLA
jgi:hypothetical protein